MGHEVTRQSRGDEEAGGGAGARVWRAAGESSECGNGPARCADGRGRRWEENPRLAGRIREPQRSKSSGRDWSNSKSGMGSGSAGSKAGV